MTDREERADEMQGLLRGEISAVETYRRALEKVGDERGAADVRRIASDHQEAVRTLRETISFEGERPDPESGAWGTFARTVERTSELFGDRGALRALREGEEHGLKQYESALRDRDLPVGLGRAIRDTIVPRQREHIATLERLIERR